MPTSFGVTPTDWKPIDQTSSNQRKRPITTAAGQRPRPSG